MTDQGTYYSRIILDGGQKKTPTPNLFFKSESLNKKIDAKTYYLLAKL